MKKSILILLLVFSILECQSKKGFDSELLTNLALLLVRSSSVQISGTAVKGIISTAKVQVLPLVNNACDRTGKAKPLAEAFTDLNGTYTLRYTKTGNPVCVLVTPAQSGTTIMYDETLKKNVSWNDKNYYLDMILPEPSGSTQKGIISSPFSRIASGVFSKIMLKADKSFANAVAKASSKQVVAMFGLNKGLLKKASKSSKSLVHTEKRDIFRNRYGKKSQSKKPLMKIRGSYSRTTQPSSVTPSLDDLQIDFNKPNDPLTAKYMLASSGISALANKVATSKSGKSINEGVTTRDTANGDAIETVIDGFSELVESGGKKESLLKDVFQKVTGKNTVPSTFARDPLEATMQTGIKSYLTESGGAAEFGITAAEIKTNFAMSSTPPANLNIDTSKAPDYLYYADNSESGALLLYQNEYEEYYPWVEGGLPTTYKVTTGTLPAGIKLNALTGDLSGIATTASTDSESITITASNIHGETKNTFKIKVVDTRIPFLLIADDCYATLYCESYFGIEINGDYPFMTNMVPTNLPAGFQIKKDPEGYYYITATNVNAITPAYYSVTLSFTAGGVNYTNQILYFMVESADDSFLFDDSGDFVDYPFNPGTYYCVYNGSCNLAPVHTFVGSSIIFEDTYDEFYDLGLVLAPNGNVTHSPGANLSGYVDLYFQVRVDGKIKESMTTFFITNGDVLDGCVGYTKTEAWGTFSDCQNGAVEFEGAGVYAGQLLYFDKCSFGQTYNPITQLCTGTINATITFCNVNNNTCSSDGINLDIGGGGTLFTTCDNKVTNDGLYSWRVPTKAELKTTIKCTTPTLVADSTACGAVVAPAVDQTLFPNSASGVYLTSSVFSVTNAWIVNFTTGGVNNAAKNTGSRVRCVSDP